MYDTLFCLPPSFQENFSSLFLCCNASLLSLFKFIVLHKNLSCVILLAELNLFLIEPPFFFQVLSKDNPPRKTYVYKLDVPVAARWISLAVAPFEILPDHQFSLISHMCLMPNLSKMRNTVEFFHSAFRFDV